MAEDNKKSPYKSALEALQRAKTKADSMKERGETLIGEGMRTLVGGACAFGAGLLDQRFGAADQSTGIRTHKVNGAPTSLLAAAAAKGFAALGGFGKYESVGFAAGDGAWNHAASSWGRQAGERLRQKSEQPAQTTTEKASESAPQQAAMVAGKGA